MNTLRKLIACLTLLTASLCLAEKKAPNPADYTINVHVTKSELGIMAGVSGSVQTQTLEVVINGEHIRLMGDVMSADLPKGHIIGLLHPGILALGDYKARLIHPNYQPNYVEFDQYEFLFPDGKTKLFQVTALYEQSSAH